MKDFYSGKPEYFEQIALGNVPNKSSEYKFGRNSVVGATELIVADGGIYGLPLTAETVTATSTSLDDVPDGDGARTLHIFGIDEDFNLIDEIMDSNGTSVGEYLRVFRAYVETAGTLTAVGGGNDGVITISQSTSTTDMIQIPATVGQTLTACYTIPAGYYGLLWSADVTTGVGKNATAYLKVKEYGTHTPFRTKGVRDSSANTAKQIFKIPTKLSAKSDIVFTAIAGAVGTPVSATFLLELVKIPAVL